ncbi:hypothetical protein LguiA_012869 [Lonicera macranthoides]
MRDQGDSPRRERWEGGYDDLEENDGEKSRDLGKHRSKDKTKSSRSEEKDHRSRDRERAKSSDIPKEREKDKDTKDSEKDRVSSRNKRKDGRDEREKDRTRDKVREKDIDRDKYRDKDRGKEKERERGRETEKDSEQGLDKERGKEKSRDRDRDKEREKERDRVKDREREKEREKHKDREKDRETDRDRDRDALSKDKGKDRIREKERETDKDRSRERDNVSWKQRDEGLDRRKDLGRDNKLKVDGEDGQYRDVMKQGSGSHHDRDSIKSTKHEQNAEGEPSASHLSAVELEERILKVKEERLKKKSEGDSEVLAWVSKSRKLEEKRNVEKEKALQLSKVFEEQDDIIQGESDDEETAQRTAQDLSGVKVLHGLDKVIEGGAVVLTLKDQSILANGDINEDVDMLINVEIGEQKQRSEAYKAAKKKTGIYVDKFNDEPGSEKKILPQYDDPVADEGVTLDANGRFTGEAEKKLEELRKRIEGVRPRNHVEDLVSMGKTSSDYYTHEEMLQFKKPKKKKSLRKKHKLDLNALEAEAVTAGLGVGDLGSRNDGKRQALKEEQERLEAEKRSSAYQSAYARADEASKALRMEKTLPIQMEEDDTPVFDDDDEDLRKSLDRARRLALKKKDDGGATGPTSFALLASSTSHNSTTDNDNNVPGESQENKVVFTEMEEFVWGLQLDEGLLNVSRPRFLKRTTLAEKLPGAEAPSMEAHKPDGEDVFMEEDVVPKISGQDQKDDDGGWTEVKETTEEEAPTNQDKEEIVPDETIHEVAVGKGLSGALRLLKDRGSLDQGIEWGGRNMDKKKSKLVGIYENDGTKEIRIERTDEYGRISNHWGFGVGWAVAGALMKSLELLRWAAISDSRGPYNGKTLKVFNLEARHSLPVNLLKFSPCFYQLTPKESFRLLSHKFHGKGPGKMKQEKRMRQYEEEQKVKQMRNSDTPSLSAERMRDAQAKMKTPYLVLSGNVKPGQTSDPRSGFATVEKDFPGGLTPMLGDRKVEHFLGIKRKSDAGDMGPPKKPKP